MFAVCRQFQMKSIGVTNQVETFYSNMYNGYNTSSWDLLQVNLSVVTWCNNQHGRDEVTAITRSTVVKRMLERIILNCFLSLADSAVLF